MATMEEQRKHRRMQIFMLLLMTIVYMGAYGYIRGTVTVILPVLSLPVSQGGLGFTNTQSGVITAFGIGGYAIGKFVNGSLVDVFGAKFIFIFCVAVATVLNVVFAMTKNFYVMTVFWFVIQFFCAPAWAAQTKLIYHWFETKKQGKAFGVISAAGAFQTAITALNFGLLLDIGFGWREVIIYSSVFSGICTLIGFVFIKTKPSIAVHEIEGGEGRKEEESHHHHRHHGEDVRSGNINSVKNVEIYNGKSIDDFSDGNDDDNKYGKGESEENVLLSSGSVNNEYPIKPPSENLPENNNIHLMNKKQAFIYFFTSFRYWSLVLQVLFLTCLNDVQQFFPLYITQTTTTSSGNASVLSSLFSIFAGFSVVLGGIILDELKWFGQTTFLVGSCFLCVVTLFVMCVLTYFNVITWWMISIGLSVFGTGITTPYYIPSGIYATKYGGAKYCGTVAAVFDGFGYLASFLADNMIGYLSDEFGWSIVLFMMVLQAVGATASMFFYQISIHPKLFQYFDCYKPKLKM